MQSTSPCNWPLDVLLSPDYGKWFPPGLFQTCKLLREARHRHARGAKTESECILPCKDLTPLSSFCSLSDLDISGCKGVTNLTPLRSLSSLVSLDCSGCDGVLDLSPLSSLSFLQNLDCSECRSVTDLTPLCGVKNLPAKKHIRSPSPSGSAHSSSGTESGGHPKGRRRRRAAKLRITQSSPGSVERRQLIRKQPQPRPELQPRSCGKQAMEALAATVAARENAKAANGPEWARAGVEQDILVLLGDKLESSRQSH